MILRQRLVYGQASILAVGLRYAKPSISYSSIEGHFPDGIMTSLAVAANGISECYNVWPVLHKEIIMHIIIGASTYRVTSELDAEAFCTVLRAIGPGALWPWLLRYKAGA